MRHNESDRRKFANKEKMYAHIIKEQMKKKNLIRKELANLADIKLSTLDKIIDGKNSLEENNRCNLAKALEMQILEVFPPDIDSFQNLLIDRFSFENESVDYFVKSFVEKPEKLYDDIVHIRKLYESSLENKDSNSKALADRMLHVKITYFHPETSKRNAVFLKQLSYIGFIELWIPHLELKHFETRSNDIEIHRGLFAACLGEKLNDRDKTTDKQRLNPDEMTRRIKHFLKKHQKSSLNDIEVIIRKIKSKNTD